MDTVPSGIACTVRYPAHLHASKALSDEQYPQKSYQLWSASYAAQAVRLTTESSR